MKHEYELFEKFPDGSSLWRDCVFDIETTRLRLREMAQKSKNRFYAIDLTTGEILTCNPERDAPALPEPSVAVAQKNNHAAHVR